MGLGGGSVEGKRVTTELLETLRPLDVGSTRWQEGDDEGNPGSGGHGDM